MENQREEYIEEGMDLDSGKSLDETIHIDEHKVYDLNGKLDLNLQVNKDGIEGYGHRNAALGDRIEVDLNKQEQHGHFSQNADLSSKRHEACMKSYSPAQYEFDHHKEEKSPKIGYDVERLHSEERENEVISGKCSDKSSSPIQTETFVEEPRNEGPVHVPMKVPEATDSRYQVENTGKSNFHYDGLKENPENEFEESLQFENPKSAFEEMDGGDGEHALGNPDYGYEAKKEDMSYSGELKSTNGELERKNVDVRAPGRTSERSVSAVREMSLSPEKGPNEEQYAGLKFSSSPYGVQDSSHSPKSSGPKRSPSSERRVEDGKRALSQDQMHLSVRRSSSISPRRRSRRDSLHRDELFQKPLSISPRRRHKSPDHRRRDRSVSRSPTRRNESSRYRRHYRDRSRSRSPRARDHYRRSPRFSPRNKSPPSSYRSRRRSPRRRPWSPPPNRSNGIGKPGNNLFIAGFNFMTTERDLERKFSRFGRVRDVRIVRDKRSGDSRGFGFLSLERDEDADEAIRALDQTEWNGRVVLVEKSKSH